MGTSASRVLKPCHHINHPIANFDSDSDFESLKPPDEPDHEYPKDTLIIFDWDDTLLCSSAIGMRQSTPDELFQLERAVISMLTAAANMGETLIVTNGNSNWVEESARKYMPGVLPLIGKLVHAISARAAHERDFPDDPFMWKRMAFDELLSNRREKGVNLVVLGDQMPEIEAARFATAKFTARALVKTIKFKVMPSIAELTGQLSKAERGLSKIVCDVGSSHRALTRRQLTDSHVSCGAHWRMLKSEAVDPCNTSKAFPLIWPILN